VKQERQRLLALCVPVLDCGELCRCDDGDDDCAEKNILFNRIGSFCVPFTIQCIYSLICKAVTANAVGIKISRTEFKHGTYSAAGCLCDVIQSIWLSFLTHALLV
jgi:hypothetical protein